jgi:RHS repeat-associated protein
MVFEQAPGSTSAADDLNYTNTTVYDALDRPTSKLIGQRALSPADQAAFGARTETFTYDASSGNGRGKLMTWKTFAPGASTPSVFDKYSYDALGNRIDTNQTLNAAGYVNLNRASGQRFNFLGGVEWNYYKDLVGGTNNTQSNTTYDKRGLPKKILLMRTGEPTLTLAEQTRNVAGLVTKRRTNTTGAMTFVEANWAYDKLGRVAGQVVQKGPGPTQVAAQALTYFGSDDPKSLAHSIGTSTKQFQYGYDLRHQLTSANETTTAGYLTSSYTYSTGGRLAAVNIAQPTPPPGSEVSPRNVTYQYGDADPERLTQLTNVVGGTPYARYTYDAAGNQTSRCYGAACSAGSASFVYDGNDRLRRATLATGSEEYTYAQDARTAVVKRDALAAKTELVWTLGDTEAHHDAAGATTHVYAHVSLGTSVARVDRTANATTSLEFQFHGLASNTIAAVAWSGAVTTAMSYTPFGELVEAATPQDHQRRFNDKQRDDTGLAYYGVRFYDPRSLEWTQSDPQYRFVPEADDEPRRSNLYSFDLGNPLSYIDPDGRDPKKPRPTGDSEKPEKQKSKSDQTKPAPPKFRPHRFELPFCNDYGWCIPPPTPDERKELLEQMKELNRRAAEELRKLQERERKENEKKRKLENKKKQPQKAKPPKEKREKREDRQDGDQLARQQCDIECVMFRKLTEGGLQR